VPGVGEYWKVCKVAGPRERKAVVSPVWLLASLNRHGGVSSPSVCLDMVSAEKGGLTNALAASQKKEALMGDDGSSITQQIRGSRPAQKQMWWNCQKCQLKSQNNWF
jgi:hypothetical protein